jgi:hypothetical protein
MAPLPDSILSRLSTILRRTPSPVPSTTFSDLSPKAALLVARAQNLLPRATLTNPGAGVTDPHDINNNAIFALFGLIGVAFIITGIWFFFWAKNGGFYFKENDWDEYKSTVLRRKGPNGTTLSGATESTDLGGGSVVHGEKNSRWGRNKKSKKGAKRYKDFDEESEMTGSAGGSSLGSEMSEMKWKAAATERKQKKPKTKLRGGELVPGEDEEVDAGVRDALRTYRHEKPARVGGLNKQADGSAWDGSTNDNSTAASELLSHREHTPTNTPTKVKKERKDNFTGGTGGIRKVVSTSQGTSSFWSKATGSNKKKDEEDERVKAQAKKLQEKGRAAQRRDFSFQTGDDNSSVTASQSASQLNGEERQARRERREARRASRSPTKKIPGSYYEESVMGSEVSGDVKTKSYHHPIPGLSTTGGSDYAEERRKKRGYRRDDN